MAPPRPPPPIKKKKMVKIFCSAEVCLLQNVSSTLLFLVELGKLSFVLNYVVGVYWSEYIVLVFVK
jgi:hypothetical protein